MKPDPTVLGYLKVVTLKNGRRVTLRPMNPGDRDKLLFFFRGLPASDRAMMKEDVTKESTVDGWIEAIGQAGMVSILAESDDRIIGDATLYMWAGGWHRHIGEVRLAVEERSRGEGLGEILAGEMVSLALQFNLDKLIAQVAREQTQVITILNRLGFNKEAELREQIMDLNGRKHDLIIMSNFVSVLWESLNDSHNFLVRLNQMED